MTNSGNIALAIFLVPVVVAISACATKQAAPMVPVAIVGVSPTLKEADLDATAQTLVLVEHALSTEGFIVEKESPKASTYSSLKEAIAAYEAKGIKTKTGMLLALSRETTGGDERILFHIYGGPRLTECERFSEKVRDVDSGIRRVAPYSAGCGLVLCGGSTLAPVTEIYLDNQPFRTTDEKGRFRETFTWPAKEYSIKFLAWVAGAKREVEEVARVRAKQTVHFRKHVNLEQKRK